MCITSRGFSPSTRLLLPRLSPGELQSRINQEARHSCLAEKTGKNACPPELPWSFPLTTRFALNLERPTMTLNILISSNRYGTKTSNRPVYLNQTLIHFKNKSLACNSCFQPCFKTESANIPQKNRITLEKMASPNLHEKNTPEFLEEYGT
jgi:hypothetical protein